KLSDLIVHQKIIFDDKRGVIAMDKSTFGEDEETLRKFNQEIDVMVSDANKELTDKYAMPRDLFKISKDRNTFFIKQEPSDFTSEWSRLQQNIKANENTGTYDN